MPFENFKGSTPASTPPDWSDLREKTYSSPPNEALVTQVAWKNPVNLPVLVFCPDGSYAGRAEKQGDVGTLNLGCSAK
jgi:hypothetical protein